MMRFNDYVTFYMGNSHGIESKQLNENTDVLEDAIANAMSELSGMKVMKTSGIKYVPQLELKNGKVWLSFVSETGKSLGGEWNLFELLHGMNKADWNQASGELKDKDPSDDEDLDYDDEDMDESLEEARSSDGSDLPFVSKHVVMSGKPNKDVSPISDVMNILFKYFPENVFNVQEADMFDEANEEQDFYSHFEKLNEVYQYLKGMIGKKEDYDSHIEGVIKHLEKAADMMRDNLAPAFTEEYGADYTEKDEDCKESKDEEVEDSEEEK